MHGPRELAEGTPPERERYIDLLRALAIVIVVLGHWTVIVVTGGAVYAFGLFPLPEPAGRTGAWLLWKLPWLVLLLLVLAALVAVVGRIEQRGAVSSRSPWTPRALGRPGPRALATSVGYAACVLGLLGLAAGPVERGTLGLPAPALAVFLFGAAVLRAARGERGRRQTVTPKAS